MVFRPAVIATAVIVFAAVAGAAALLSVRHHSSHPGAARNLPRTVRTTPPAPGVSSSDLSGSEPAPSPSAISSGPSSENGITVGAGAAQDPDAPSVADFLGQYFTAINNRDYQSYLSLQSPQIQQGMTQEKFEEGYRSTVDSSETLVGISTSPDGDLAADVTFTSHQDPADSPDQSESCTNWSITLFLNQDGSGYLIDPAPSGYHASYQPCS